MTNAPRRSRTVPLLCIVVGGSPLGANAIRYSMNGRRNKYTKSFARSSNSVLRLRRAEIHLLLYTTIGPFLRALGHSYRFTAVSSVQPEPLLLCLPLFVGRRRQDAGLDPHCGSPSTFSNAHQPPVYYEVYWKSYYSHETMSSDSYLHRC